MRRYFGGIVYLLFSVLLCVWFGISLWFVPVLVLVIGIVVRVILSCIVYRRLGIPELRSGLDRLRRERVELLGLIDGCYYHISMNEPYISDPMTGVLWMRYDRLKKLDREIELMELDLRLASEIHSVLWV